MQTHIIGKQIIELSLGSDQDTFAMQQEISWILKNQVMPRVEAMLDRLISPDIVIRLDELELDLGFIDPDNLERDFTESLLKHFEQVLVKKLEEAASSAGKEMKVGIPLQISILDAWKFFLEKGFMPWWVEEKDWKVWEEKVIAALSKAPKGFSSQLTALKLQEKVIIQRLVWQFSEEVLLALIQNHSKNQVLDIQRMSAELLDFIQTLPQLTITKEDNKEYFWTVVLELLFKQKLVNEWKPSVVKAFYKEIARKNKFTYKELVQKSCELSLSDIQSGAPKLPEYLEKIVIHLWKEDIAAERGQIDKAEKSIDPLIPHRLSIEEKSGLKDVKQLGSTVEEGSTLYVQNAGLVIVHPFLPILFKELGYVDKHDFLNEEARQRAIHLLQYLVNGKFEAKESELSLNKLLCGLPLNMPVKHSIALTNIEKEEANHLLETVVGHWKALKNTSPDGLRINYFIREGKLAFTEMGWKLQVEQKTQDIMLGRLPWGISMIKMPWMPDMLRIEWN